MSMSRTKQTLKILSKMGLVAQARLKFQQMRRPSWSAQLGTLPQKQEQNPK